MPKSESELSLPLPALQTFLVSTIVKPESLFVQIPEHVEGFDAYVRAFDAAI